MNKVSPQVALSRLQKICSLQEKCIADVTQKLVKWEISGEDGQKIIEKLIGDKFIDEERFAVFYVRDKSKIYKWGREKIKYSLIHKGIPPEIIDIALTEINEDKYNDTLKELLIRKRKEIKSKNIYELKGKLIRFGTQRGYSYEIVYKLVDEVLKD